MGYWSKMEMIEEDLIKSELENSGTSWTKNEFFDANGYLIIKKICDTKIKQTISELYFAFFTQIKREEFQSMGVGPDRLRGSPSKEAVSAGQHC